MQVKIHYPILTKSKRMKFLKASVKTASCPEETFLSPEEEKCFMNDLGHYAKNKGERECLKKLYLFCQQNDIPIPSQLLFRFGCCHDFNYEKAKKTIEENHNHRYFSVKMDDELAEYMHENLVVLPLQGAQSQERKLSSGLCPTISICTRSWNCWTVLQSLGLHFQQHDTNRRRLPKWNHNSKLLSRLRPQELSAWQW